MSRYVAELITTDAGCFGPVGLCQLRTQQVCMQLTKCPASAVIDSAVYVFAYDQFADVDNAAMSLSNST